MSPSQLDWRWKLTWLNDEENNVLFHVIRNDILSPLDKYSSFLIPPFKHFLHRQLKTYYRALNISNEDKNGTCNKL